MTTITKWIWTKIAFLAWLSYHPRLTYSFSYLTILTVSKVNYCTLFTWTILFNVVGLSIYPIGYPFIIPNYSFTILDYPSIISNCSFIISNCPFKISISIKWLYPFTWIGNPVLFHNFLIIFLLHLTTSSTIPLSFTFLTVLSLF